MKQFIRVNYEGSKDTPILAELQKRFFKKFEREVNINFYINTLESCNIQATREEAEQFVDDIYNNKD
jgi:hypothetical protein